MELAVALVVGDKFKGSH